MEYKIYIVLFLSLVLAYLIYSNCSKKGSSSTISESSEQENQTENFGNDSRNPTLKLYYTNWCGWSQKFLPVWDQLQKILKIKMEKIDCEQNKELCQGVPGYPYIVLERGNEKVVYNGNRTAKDIEMFIKNNTY